VLRLLWDTLEPVMLIIDKVGAFGIFVDVEAIVTDALGAAP
jgi:hypothetical protein